MIRIAVAYATLGRPELLARTVDHLLCQTRKPDVVVVSAAQASDIAGLDRLAIKPDIIIGDKGLCQQRNRALAAVAGRADVVLFFDDDFVPREDYVEQTVALFAARPELAGATGHVIADGIKTPGIGFDEAIALIRQEPPRAAAAVSPRDSLYGCNMAIRMRAATGLEFDERLPLYGWLEDADYTYRLGRRGPLVMSQALVGVHLGTKGGRTSERRLGYSQIANPLYMLQKKSIPRKMAAQKIIRNVAANALGCILPVPYINRPSRLAGNMIAIKDCALNRISPDRILEMDK